MANVYNTGKEAMTSNGDVDWSSNTIVGILVTSAYVYDADHDFISDLSGECTNTGYSRQTLANKTKAKDDNQDNVAFSADPPNFGNMLAGDQPAGVVIAKSTGVDSSSPLICFLELTAAPVPDGSGYVVNFSADGILSLED